MIRKTCSIKFIVSFLIFSRAIFGVSIVKEEFIFTHSSFASCHASTIVEIKPNILLAAWFGGSEESAKDVGIWLSKWEKNKWGVPIEIVKAEGEPCWNPVLFMMPSGEILLFYRQGPSPRTWTTFIRRSIDEGVSWSKAEKLPAGVLGPIKNKPLLRQDGTLVCGSSVESWNDNACWIELTNDAGKTWEKKGPIYLEDPNMGIIQPALYWGVNNDLTMLCRSRPAPKRLCRAVSSDQGITWSKVEITEIPNPDSAIDIVNIKEGPIVLVYNPTATSRAKLAVAVSHDSGITWSDALYLEDHTDGEYSYPAVIESEDGLVHITYTWQREKIKHVVLKLAEKK